MACDRAPVTAQGQGMVGVSFAIRGTADFVSERGEQSVDELLGEDDADDDEDDQTLARLRLYVPDGIERLFKLKEKVRRTEQQHTQTNQRGDNAGIPVDIRRLYHITNHVRVYAFANPYLHLIDNLLLNRAATDENSGNGQRNHQQRSQ